MKTYSQIVKFYDKYLIDHRHIPMRMMSPFRYVLRKIVNIVARISLSKDYTSPNKIASDYLQSNGITKKLIVSFTSFPARINNVWMIVEIMRRQTIRPDKIVLYLSKLQFPNGDNIPKNLQDRISDDFSVELVEGDYRSYKKFMYSFEEYKDDLVLLIDDDILYTTDMIESMLYEYVRDQNSVICRFACLMGYSEKDQITSYNTWPFVYDKSDNQNMFFGTGGGSLYAPSKLYKDTCNRELFFRLAPKADDVWLNAMVRISGLSIRKLYCGELITIENKKNVTLSSDNVVLNQNDSQLKDVIAYYRNLGITIFQYHENQYVDNLHFNKFRI